jgi:hypothetical protein
MSNANAGHHHHGWLVWMVLAWWNRMAILFHGFKETESLCNAFAVLFSSTAENCVFN